MNCAAAETWLLTARSASELPGAVRAHLAECRGCAKRLMSLTRTDSAVRRYVTDAGDLLPRLHKLTRSDCTTRNRRKATQLANDYTARMCRS